MKKKTKRKWYCWYCGELVPDNGQFVLWSLNKSIDRVFIIHFKKECVNAVRAGNKDTFFLQGIENKVYDF